MLRLVSCEAAALAAAVAIAVTICLTATFPFDDSSLRLMDPKDPPSAGKALLTRQNRSALDAPVLGNKTISVKGSIRVGRHLVSHAGQ